MTFLELDGGRWGNFREEDLTGTGMGMNFEEYGKEREGVNCLRQMRYLMARFFCFVLHVKGGRRMMMQRDTADLYFQVYKEFKKKNDDELLLIPLTTLLAMVLPRRLISLLLQGGI